MVKQLTRTRSSNVYKGRCWLEAHFCFLSQTSIIPPSSLSFLVLESSVHFPSLMLIYFKIYQYVNCLTALIYWQYSFILQNSHWQATKVSICACIRGKLCSLLYHSCYLYIIHQFTSMGACLSQYVMHFILLLIHVLPVKLFGGSHCMESRWRGPMVFDCDLRTLVE